MDYTGSTQRTEWYEHPPLCMFCKRPCNSPGDCSKPGSSRHFTVRRFFWQLAHCSTGNLLWIKELCPSLILLFPCCITSSSSCFSSREKDCTLAHCTKLSPWVAKPESGKGRFSGDISFRHSACLPLRCFLGPRQTLTVIKHLQGFTATVTRLQASLWHRLQWLH